MVELLAVVMLALVLGVGAHAWLRMRTDDGQTRAADSFAHPYHGVTIAARGRGCDAVCSLRGRRFLATEAPLLPLSDCSQVRCTCVYEHFTDRRFHDRRHHERRSVEREDSSGDRRIGERRRLVAHAGDDAGFALP